MNASPDAKTKAATALAASLFLAALGVGEHGTRRAVAQRPHPTGSEVES
ncbi:MAG TPA: hypothetical protein VHU19_18235 [Pyrinomonadaceae bacterium]|nr:hypothetical protein [Pyrinomonadaceae bacterium]